MVRVPSEMLYFFSNFSSSGEHGSASTMGKEGSVSSLLGLSSSLGLSHFIILGCSDNVV